jgi:acetyl-CoA acetyltransferase
VLALHEGNVSTDSSELRRIAGRYALVTVCMVGGQGIAAIAGRR